MAESEQDKDPSIEEILASIRQIISDDEEDVPSDDGAASPVAAEESNEVDSVPETESQDDIDAMFDTPDAPEAEAPAEDDDDDVLELTQKIEEDGSVTDTEVDAVDVAPEPEPEPEPEPISDVEEAPVEEEIEVALEDAIPADPHPEPIKEPEPETAPERDLDTEILTNSAAAATLAGFTKLARDIQVSRSFEGVTLEDIVRAQLEPLLREWLDKNLPPMIERLVTDELERISKKALG